MGNSESEGPKRYVRYGRTSTEHDPCPADQLESLKLPSKMQSEGDWSHVGDYCDGGLTGRDPLQRRALRKLLDQVRSGQIKIDAILVESLERLARQDFQAICEELNKHGIMLLIADI